MLLNYLYYFTWIEFCVLCCVYLYLTLSRFPQVSSGKVLVAVITGLKSNLCPQVYNGSNYTALKIEMETKIREFSAEFGQVEEREKQNPNHSVFPLLCRL